MLDRKLIFTCHPNALMMGKDPMLNITYEGLDEITLRELEAIQHGLSGIIDRRKTELAKLIQDIAVVRIDPKL